VKLCYLGVLIGSFVWAAISFYSEAASWKDSETGRAGSSDILLSGKWSKCIGHFPFNSACGSLGEFVSMRLEVDKNSAAVFASVSVSFQLQRGDNHSEVKSFLVIRRPITPDLFSEDRYEKRAYVDQWIELKETPPLFPSIVKDAGSYRFTSVEGRGEVIPMSAEAWWSRPFGSHETMWVLYVAKKKKGSGEELALVDTLHMTYPVGVTLKVDTTGLEQEKHLLQLGGATWLNDGLGLMRVSYKPSAGVKAF
jgi:hypothetical protein